MSRNSLCLCSLAPRINTPVLVVKASPCLLTGRQGAQYSFPSSADLTDPTARTEIQTSDSDSHSRLMLDKNENFLTCVSLLNLDQAVCRSSDVLPGTFQQTPVIEVVLRLFSMLKVPFES